MNQMKKNTGESSSGILAAVSLVVTVALAVAIEKGWVSWSWWWLVLTAAPFAMTILVAAAGLIGVAGFFAWQRWAPPRWRRRRW